MKQKINKTLTLIMVVLLLFATTITALASDTTTIGTDNVTAEVPVEGSIDSINISVTHPVIIEYTIDPNADIDFEFIAPNIVISNNTKVSINVSVQSLTSSVEGTIQFADVDPADKDWLNLNVADSKEFIVLGIYVKNPFGWNNGFNEGTHYTVNTETT